MKIFIKTKNFNKDYLINTSKYEYKSSLDLILELFSEHRFVDKEAELYLYELLKASNYSSIDQIPTLQLNAILDYFLENRDQYKVNYDEERLSYLLLAAIKANRVLFTVDNRTISNLEDAVLLNGDSVIHFFNIDKLETINFKLI